MARHIPGTDLLLHRPALCALGRGGCLCALGRRCLTHGRHVACGSQDDARATGIDMAALYPLIEYWESVRAHNHAR
eukprot:4936649-Pleurochrysis_carterae.AAC.3